MFFFLISLLFFLNYAVNMPFNAVKMAIFTWESVGFDFSSQSQVANKYSIFFLTQPQPWEAVPWDDYITNKCTRADLDGPPGMCFFF